MRTRFLLIAQVVVWLALLQGITWAQEKYTPSQDEELYGIWTNGKMFPPQLVANPDGTFEEHFPISNPKAFRSGTIEIVRKWTGSDGSLYYYRLDTITRGADRGRKAKALWKISELLGRSSRWFAALPPLRRLTPTGCQQRLIQKSPTIRRLLVLEAESTVPCAS